MHGYAIVVCQRPNLIDSFYVFSLNRFHSFRLQFFKLVSRANLWILTTGENNYAKVPLVIYVKAFHLSAEQFNWMGGWGGGGRGGEKLPCKRAEDTSGKIEVKHHCRRTISTQLKLFLTPKRYYLLSQQVTKT